MIGQMGTFRGNARWYLSTLLLLMAIAVSACDMLGHIDRVEPRPEITPSPTVTPGGQATVSYREDIAPILGKSCTSCHGGQIGLYLDSYHTLLAGSSWGKVIIPGDTVSSTLLQRIKGEIQPRMPLNRPSMSTEDIALIETWIMEGAVNN
jgi:hypothetical protein